MNKKLPYTSVLYEQWLEQHPFILQSEVEALKAMLPDGESTGIQLGDGSGILPAGFALGAVIDKRYHLHTFPQEADMTGSACLSAENLPYDDHQFDFILITCTACCFDNLHALFTEAYRVLRKTGVLIVGLFDRESFTTKFYQHDEFKMYNNCCSVDEVVFELNLAGFVHFDFCQTIFKPLDDIDQMEPVKKGFGEGAFVVIQSGKIIP